MYKVIKFFTDLQDNDFAYEVGAPFPREGLEVTEDRLAELASSNNRRRQPLIEKVEEKTNLEKMKKDELQAYAKEKGIAFDDADTKDKISAKIKEAEAKK